MQVDRLRYELQLLGGRVFFTPILVMLGFTLIAVLLRYLKVNPARFLSGGLEMILPIAAAVVIATVISHDPAIELQLTLPHQYRSTGMKRLLLAMLWTCAIALISSGIIQALHMAYIPTPLALWSVPAQFLVNQLIWLAPLFWLVGIGLCLSIFLHSRTASGALLGGIWILEIIFKDLLAATPWLQPVLLFPTTLIFFPIINLPGYLFAGWLVNRFEILGTGVILLGIAWLLLRNPERLLKGAVEE
ncbi:MAG TPA: hypothetical protein VFA41_02855 [Ktedonobacteraceae bacterium]|nr:hypothetical protein [Ktedonobacteraceae bacterium]